jgi:DNA-binding MarR family transcriptional regulator
MRERHPAQAFLRRIAWSAPYLAALADGRPRSSLGLASVVGVSPSSATRHLRALRHLGLVDSEPSTEEAGLLHRLTPQGRAWMRRPLVKSCRALERAPLDPDR